MARSFERKYERLNEAQRRAVDTIDGPVLVIAGPGTGKTQLLSMRVANILQRTDVNASNILCLTFTESGQQAIQQRLIELIGEAAKKVVIHTFHAFGSAIISAHPESFYDAAQARPADDLTLFEILQSIFEKLPHGGPLSSQNGEEFVFLKDAQERISQLKTAGLTPDELREVLQRDREWCRLATPLIQKVYGQFSRYHKKYLPLLEDLAEKLQVLQVQDSPLAWLQPIAHSCMVELNTALEEAHKEDSSGSISRWRAKWLESVNDQLQLKAQTQHERLEVLADIYEQYLAALRRRHVYDYDDMILEVLQALGSQADLRASLQEQFQYILVDEYQDTNGAQARLLELLADNPVHEGRPNIMVVGDDDQAIYGFQGADTSVMLRFRERWRDVTTIVLTDNYRSSQPILDTARQLIIQGESRLENYYPDIVKQLVARANAIDAKPRLVSLEHESQLYSWLARELKSLVATGVAPDSIAVIAPRHKYLQRLLPYMLQTGVDVAYERQTNVLTEPVTRQFLELTRLIDAIARGKQGEAQTLLPEILSYDWWPIAPEDIWQLSLSRADGQANTSLLRMATGTHEGLKDLAEWLTDMAAQSAEEPLEKVLERLLVRLGDRVDIAQLQRHVDSILYGLQQYRPGHDLSLHDFVRYVVLNQQAGLSITAHDVTVTGEHAVHLMTAHKAKGLEFDHVYLLNVTNHVWLTEKGLINKLSLPANLLVIQPAGETTDDRLRMLYVAATRARNLLSFATFSRAEDKRQHSPLQWLAGPAVELSLTTLRPSIGGGQAPPPAQMLEDWRARHYTSLKRPDLQTQLQPFLQRYRLSPTHLLTFLDVTQGGPRQFLVRHLLQFPEAVSINMIFGNALHQTLEAAQAAVSKSGKLPSVTVLQARFEAALSDHHLRKVERQKLLDRGSRALEHYLAARGETFTKNNLAEQNFRSENVTLGQACLTGKIDRLSLDLAEHQASVTDFKTGKPFFKWQAASDYDKHKLHKYRQQLLFYKLLIEGSKSFQKFKVTEGIVEFVEPDRWGRVSHLNYEYSDTEQQRLEQLIHVIWDKIMRLDLPDVSSYPATFKGVENFEQDLLDGTV